MSIGDGHLGDALSGLLDGELTEDEVAAARTHLADCPPCRDELEATRATRTALRLLPAVEPPGGWLDGMTNVVDLASRRRRRWPVASAVASTAMKSPASANSDSLVPPRLLATSPW